MLQAHYLAPHQTISAPELALTVGVANYRAVNLHYGGLGAILRECSDVLSAIDGQKSHVLAKFISPSALHPYWRFSMHQGLVHALANLAWFSSDLEVAESKELLTLTAREGFLTYRLVAHRHRESSLRLTKLAQVRKEHPNGRLICEVPGCDFDFADKYGTPGIGYAEVHHLIPLADLSDDHVTTLSDLVVVCANCHRIIHRGGECRSISDLIAL